MATSSKDECGQHLVMLAIIFPVLLAMFGLIVDLGTVYLHHRQGQNAADAAALAGATALCGGQDATSAALAFANKNGYPNSGTSQVGVEVGSAWVRVTVQDVVDPIFTKIFWNGTFTVPASAKAACTDAAPWPSMLVLNHTDCNSLDVKTGTLLVPLGYVHVNSNGTTGKNECLGNATYVQPINGILTTLNPSQFRGSCPTCVDNANVTPPPVTGPGVPLLPDPLAGLEKPNPGGNYPTDCKVICQDNGAHACDGKPTPWQDPSTSRWHYPPGIYAKTVTVNTGETAYFDNVGQTIPLTCGSMNLYGFKDLLKVNGNSTVIGHEMTWFFESPVGQLNIAGGTNLDLSAPSSGYYKNILIYQQRGNTTDMSIMGNSGSVLQGVIYVPSALLKLGGNPGSRYNATVVVDKLALDGGPIVTVTGLSSGEGLWHWVRLVE